MQDKIHEELEFTLDPKSGVPFYKQIILQIEMAIADKRLNQGDQLPTVRGLAVDLQVNPNTVARAYSELEIRGIVNTQQGTGTFISDKKIKLTEVERERILAELVRGFVSKASSYGFSLAEIRTYLEDLEKDKEE
ncbi:MAG: GntR family transcriptional regulator [Spirochaetales bacterium]|nr:GntR family transcriptional regulator [Spirochaetales bacterium]